MGSKNYVYSDFSIRDSLVLEVEGTKYEVAQFSASWAANELPTATLMLAIGRNVRTDQPATVHTQNNSKQMRKASVYFSPTKEYDLDADWPAGRKLIFDGYLTGFGYRKVGGKVTVIANLIHWLAALGFSSSLTKNGHISNPTALNAAAVLSTLGDPGAGQGIYVSNLVGAEITASDAGSDLWKAIKNVFCKLASIETMSCGPDDACLGPGTYAKNDVALEALSKMEGPAPDCEKAYEYGVALGIEGENIDIIESAIALAIGQEFIESWSGTTFWDKLVGQYCPMFGLAVVPMVETAIVVADTPAFNGGFWKEVTADDCDYLDLSAELYRPLRGVGVVVNWESQTQLNVDDVQPSVLIGGCFVADSVKAADGSIMYVSPPPWLRMVKSLPDYVSETTGIKTEAPSKTATTPVDPPPPEADTFSSGATAINRLCGAWAQEVYVSNMLRGRMGSFSGKLRFDIAPLSIIKLKHTGEKLIGSGQDQLAVTVYGCVQRVTITINAEAGLAGTNFTMSHVRTEIENDDPRTSVSKHPLFGTKIHGNGLHGSPLQPAYDLGAKGSSNTGALVGDGPTPAGQPGTVSV